MVPDREKRTQMSSHVVQHFELEGCKTEEEFLYLAHLLYKVSRRIPKGKIDERPFVTLQALCSFMQFVLYVLEENQPSTETLTGQIMSLTCSEGSGTSTHMARLSKPCPQPAGLPVIQPSQPLSSALTITLLPRDSTCQTWSHPRTLGLAIPSAWHALPPDIPTSSVLWSNAFSAQRTFFTSPI